MKNRDLLRLSVVIVFVFVAAIIPISVMAAPPQQGPATYYVQPGDTLFSIAMRYGTNVPAVMSANGLMSDYIYAGQRLTIPAGYNPYGSNWYYRGYYPYYWRYGSSIYSPQPLPTVVPLPNPTFGCTYTVVAKDTVFSIAYRYRVSVPTLMQANNLFSPIIYVGQPLKVPCEVTPPTVTMYTIQPGDNLLRIAIKYNTTIYALSLVNGIYNPNWIFAGQVIAIPYPGSYVWPTPGTPTATTAPGATPTPTNTPSTQANAVVVMTNKAFIPGTITINKGGTVLWQNNDPFTHTVTSGVPGNMDNKFRSPQLGQGQTFPFTFNITGTFPYFSETDQNMTGTVIVQ